MEWLKRNIHLVELIGFALTIIAIVISFALTETAKLEVWHEINDENKNDTRLLIWVKNNAIFKETGTIYFFRLEVSDSKPHQILDSIKPREVISIPLNLSINVSETPTLATKQVIRGACPIPEFKPYFATEKETSISYRINCENCYSQGVIVRIPEISVTDYLVTIFTNGTCQLRLPVYSWTEFGIEDIIEK